MESLNTSKKNIRKNYLLNVSYQILNIITPFITAPYLSRVLEPDGIGTVSFAESIVSYFSLVAVMGTSTYGQREISFVQNDPEKRSVVFWNTKILSFFTSGITILLYLVFAFLQKENANIYVILTLNLFANFVDITWLYQGMEEFSRTVIRNSFFKIIQIVYIFTVVKGKDDLILYVLGIGLFNLLGNVSLWADLPKYIKKVSISELHPFKDFKVVLSLFIPTIAISIYTVLDKTMIGVITENPFENGYYEQALKVSKILLTLITSLGIVMSPRIGSLFVQGTKEDIQRYVYRGIRFVWFLGVPLCLGTIMVAGNFVPWFFGAGYDKAIPVLRVLSLLIPIVGLSNVTGTQYLVPTKRQSQYTFSVVFGAVVNMLLNMLMISLFQSVGAAIASVIAEMAVTTVQLVFIRKDFSMIKIIKESTHYLIAGAVMVLILIPITKWLTPSIIHTLIIVTIGAVTYITILLIEKDEFLISNIRMFLCKRQ